MRKAAVWLYPFTCAYSLVTRSRNFLYDRGIIAVHRSRLPVISVGNISCGGNAKTPLCSYLSQILLERGYRPVVLSRGYGGTVCGPRLVLGWDSYKRVGDEACMLVGQGATVVIARDRVMGCRFIEEQALGDVIILDDGFQHRRLHRDLDIVSLNVSSPQAISDLLAARLLPTGRLREDRDRALARADALVFSYRKRLPHQPTLDARLQALAPRGKPVYSSALEVQGLFSLCDEQRRLEPAAKIVAFCAIAAPEGFFETLSGMGYEVMERRTFGDHHPISAGDLDGMRRRFPGVPLVCTAKDAVKIDPSWGQNIYVLQVKIRVWPEADFLVQIMSILNARRIP